MVHTTTTTSIRDDVSDSGSDVQDARLLFANRHLGPSHGPSHGHGHSHGHSHGLGFGLGFGHGFDYGSANGDEHHQLPHGDGLQVEPSRLFETPAISRAEPLSPSSVYP
jgi:hypothetical protein